MNDKLTSDEIIWLNPSNGNRNKLGWTWSLKPEMGGSVKYIRADLAKALVDQAHKDEWISIEDRLPEPKDDDKITETGVWVVANGHVQEESAAFYKGTWRWLSDGLVIDDVTHWMLLPEPPQA